MERLSLSQKEFRFTCWCVCVFAEDLRGSLWCTGSNKNVYDVKIFMILMTLSCVRTVATRHQMAKVLKVESIGNALCGALDYFCRSFQQNFAFCLSSLPIFLSHTTYQHMYTNKVSEWCGPDHSLGWKPQAAEANVKFSLSVNLWKLV